MFDFPSPQRGSIRAEDNSLFQKEGQPQASLCYSLAPPWWSNSLSEVAVSLTTTLSGTCGICYSLSSEIREKMICQTQLILSHAKAAFMPPLMLLTKLYCRGQWLAGLCCPLSQPSCLPGFWDVSGIHQQHPQHHHTLLRGPFPWECVNLFLSLPKSLSSCGNSGQSAAVSLHSFCLKPWGLICGPLAGSGSAAEDAVELKPPDCHLAQICHPGASLCHLFMIFKVQEKG